MNKELSIFLKKKKSGYSFRTFFCSLYLFLCLSGLRAPLSWAAPASPGASAQHGELELLRKDISDIKDMLAQLKVAQEQMAKEIQGIKIRIRRSGGGNA